MVLRSSSDTALVRSAMAGRAEAFEALIERHQRTAHAVARAQGVNAASVDDVVQDAFLKAFRELPRLRDRTKFAPWLVHIVRNTACSEHRRSRRAPASTESVEAAVSPPPETLESRELRELLRRKVGDLPETIREAIFLYYYEGRSTAKVARALGTTRAAVKKRLQKGRDLLRAELWRELHEELRELLPSTRRWKEKARLLALAAAVAPGTGSGLDASDGVAGGVSSLGQAAFISGGVTVTSKTLLGILILVVVAWWCLWPGPSSDETKAPPVARSPDASDGDAASDSSAASRPQSPGPGDNVQPVRPGVTAPALQVRVVAPDGGAIRGAAVRVQWIDVQDGSRSIDRDALEKLTETEDGIYASSETQRGNSALIHTAALGFALAQTTVENLEPGQIVTIELEEIETAQLRFYAPLEGDRPIAGVLVGPIVGDLIPGGAKSGFPPSGFRRNADVKRLYTERSDEEGRAAISSEAGRLWVTHEDYGPCSLSISTLRQPHGGTEYSVPLYPVTRLRIRVRRADGATVESFRYAIGTDVRNILDLHHEAAGAEVVHPLYLQYYLDPHARLDDRLVVTAASGAPRGSARGTLEPGVENEVEIVLNAQPTSIAGTVLDASGQPVEGATVAAISGEARSEYILDDQLRRSRVPRVTTAVDGRYRIQFDATPDPVWIVVMHSARPFHLSERLELLPNESRRHDVRLAQGATVTARYRPEHLEKGDPEVKLTNENRSEYPSIDYRRSAPAGGQGTFRLERVPPGAWTLRWMSGRLIRRQPICVEDGRSYEITLGRARPANAVHVTGTLLADGQPVQDIGLWMWDTTTGHVAATAQTDPDGTFDLGWIEPGRHRLAVGIHSRSKSSRVPLQYRTVELRDETVPMVIDASTRTVVGRVLDADGPVAAATIRAVTVQPIEQQSILTTFHRAQSDADGVYRLDGVYDVPSVLVFEKSEYLPRRIPWTPAGSNEVALEDALLERAEDKDRIRVRILDSETETPIAKARLQLEALGFAAPLGAGRFEAGANPGEFVSDPQPAGRYRVLARAGKLGVEYYTAEVVEFEHVPGNAPVTIHCRRGTAVQLDLNAADGVPPDRAFVEVEDANGEPLLNWHGTRRLGFSGSATLVGLPFGEVRVTVSAPGWKTLRFPLTVAPGRVARVSRHIERSE